MMTPPLPPKKRKTCLHLLTSYILLLLISYHRVISEDVQKSYIKKCRKKCLSLNKLRNNYLLSHRNGLDWLSGLD